MSRSMSSLTPRSGTLRIALRKLRDQFSNRDCSTVYKKDAFEPFQTPHAPSLCQTWLMTSSTESGCRMFKYGSESPALPEMDGGRGDLVGETPRRFPCRLEPRGVGVLGTFEVK